jgi:hypothetical protein
MDLATYINAPVSKANLLANLCVYAPPSRYDTGCDELGADVTLAEFFFIHVLEDYNETVNTL